jgi:hypothetical protein
VDSPELLGQCEAGYSCAYMNSICWRSPKTPMPMEDRPRVVFERLFGDSESTDAKVRLQRIKRDRSILDSVTNKAARLSRELGRRRNKLDEYLDASATSNTASRRRRSRPTASCRRWNVLPAFPRLSPTMRA